MDVQTSKLVYRKDVLAFLLNNTHLHSDELFDMIIKGKGNNNNLSAQGFLFETMVEILLITKCINGLNYTSIHEGQLNNLKIINNVQKLLNKQVLGQGGNKVDVSIQYQDTIIAISIKYRKNYGETDVCKIDTIARNNNLNNYKIGLVVKDKDLYLKHKYINNDDEDKKAIDTINNNNLLFDQLDIIKGLNVFCQTFQNNQKNIDEFMDFINTDYLSSPRIHLTKKFHQRMQEIQYDRAGNNDTCNSHKPRSGKTISTLLNIQTDIIKGYEKALLITPVPSTISNYIDECNKYIEFKNINYVTQDKFHMIDSSFQGVAFCSLQYLKKNSKYNKVELLEKINFNQLHVDECHIGAATNKTNTEILNYKILDDITGNNNKSKKNFISGTPDKTINYYNIPKSSISQWDIEDEAYMKLLGNSNIESEEKNYIINYMSNRHGEAFVECLNDETLNKDYSKCPTPVLMQPTIPRSLIDEIKKYNSINNSNYGYNCSSLFALKQIIDENGNVKYTDEFQLCETIDGKEILMAFFNYIISSNKMDNSIMKEIEKEQTRRNSRKSSVETPLLHILYLPTHTGNNTIAILQKTIKKFLQEYNLWANYNIEYSNSIDDTGDVKENYKEYVVSIMNRTKKEKKRGCILLLGDKGGVGVTYKDCDVTISLDDGSNLDKQKQKYYRALTEAPDKTIGINVDLNIQRTYSYIINTIQKHRINTKTNKSNAEILFYLSKQNIFIFNPQDISSGNMKTTDILSYYDKVADNILNIMDDTAFLENIICDDKMRGFITSDLHKRSLNKFNEDLEGLQQDCPRGDSLRTFIDAPNNNDNQPHLPDNNTLSDEEKTIYINKTYELCKNDMFPFLGMLSRLYKIKDFNTLFTHPTTKWQMESFLVGKTVDIEKYDVIVNIMNTILDENQYSVNGIREIYSRASNDKLRLIVAKNFVPTNEEKTENAEFSTPVFLVDALLDKLPEETWTKPCKVFEPCCGKGNIILGIFDKFYNGLAVTYPDTIERCKVIATECLYYADKTYLNVFITNTLLKFHIQSYCGLDELDYEFNSYIGDSLALNIHDKWNLQYFDVVIGNYPFNSPGIGTGNTIWQSFATKAINWTRHGGYVLAIHPPGWRKPNSKKGKFTKLYNLLAKDNQIVYLEIHGTKDGLKIFNCGTRYDWYLLERTTSYKNSIVVDENYKEFNIDLNTFSWLPNSNILEIYNMIANNNEDKCPIIYDRSAYGADNKTLMSAIEDKIFKYPCVHSTPKEGIRYMYSREDNKGHFGISKVIFGEGGIYNPILDMQGKFGMTHGAMAIQISNEEEGKKIVNAITSPKFKNEFIDNCKYSSYRIDWNIFKDLKREFYNKFI